MSKVISFSISDRYLDKLRSLYPSLTDNLAAKQFLTDRLDSSLGNSLDASLDDKLDDRVKTLIESWVDGLLDERLDATVGKSLTSLSERLTRLEARLDTNLDGSLDDMEPLLKLQRESSIATSPIPTEEPSPLPPSPSLPPDELGEGVSVTTPDSPPSPLDQPAIGTLTPEVPPSPPSPVKEAIEHSEKKIMEPVGGSDSLDTLPVPLITDKTIDQNAIETVPGETDSSIETVTDAIEITNREKAAILGIDDSNLSKWVRNGEIPKKYDNKCRFNENKTKIILI
ncbi:hypothetical protein [Microcystis aeruginosa]|jgi:hypothetical protein|uniref:Uncharacterized protein n=1 Tax=Microcystis aeruginosa NIES-44 TaxID=449439 RepID=A0A0A1W360_MICAE|nr:hypothetical protein [Microcystis aeruginosa]GAL95931.1 hypothetical protein N44_04787 [Microcystis aeruginosa NIES-44]